MNSLTLICLLAVVINVAYSAGAECPYADTITKPATEWNYKQGAGEWTCGACKTNKG